MAHAPGYRRTHRARRTPQQPPGLLAVASGATQDDQQGCLLSASAGGTTQPLTHSHTRVLIDNTYPRLPSFLSTYLSLFLPSVSPSLSHDLSHRRSLPRGFKCRFLAGNAAQLPSWFPAPLVTSSSRRCLRFLILCSLYSSPLRRLPRCSLPIPLFLQDTWIVLLSSIPPSFYISCSSFLLLSPLCLLCFPSPFPPPTHIRSLLPAQGQHCNT